MSSIVPAIASFVLSLLLIGALCLLFGVVMIVFVFVQAMWQALWSMRDKEE